MALSWCDFKMRPRFSLKWLLIAFTVLSVICFVLFIRPTVNAHGFIETVKSGDFESLQTMRAEHRGLQELFFQLADESIPTSDVQIVAKLEPRTWRDVWTLKQRVGLRVEKKLHRPDLYQEYEISYDDYRVTASPIGYH